MATFNNHLNLSKPKRVATPVNPLSAMKRKLGLKGLTIGVVAGDDILGRLDTLRDGGVPLKNMESGESLDAVRDRIVSANVYFGARPIVKALMARLGRG